MKNKEMLYIVLSLIVIVGVGWYLFGLNKQKLEPVGQAPNSESTQGSKDAPKIEDMPKFVLGNVSKTEGQTVFIKVGTVEKTVSIDEKTEIIKQVKEAGIYKNISAEFSEIKSPMQIVVYYNDVSGSEYKAVKIQILNF